MAQFDVFRLGTGILVVDLQTDLIGLDASRILAPLLQEGAFVAFPGLTPSVNFNSKSWTVRVPQLSGVPENELHDCIASLESAYDELKRALDILIDGF